MTKKREELDIENYAISVIAEISAWSDKEVMDAVAEEHSDPKVEAARVRRLLLDAANRHGKGRLDAAKAKIAQEDARQAGVAILSFTAKRAKFDRIISNNPGLTLAARQGKPISEADLDGYLADFEELGLADPDEA